MKLLEYLLSIFFLGFGSDYRNKYFGYFIKYKIQSIISKIMSYYNLLL